LTSRIAAFDLTEVAGHLEDFNLNAGWVSSSMTGEAARRAWL
jgi:hypothetical protein